VLDDVLYGKPDNATPRARCSRACPAAGTT
jgi:hypothetical protein